MSKRKSWNRPLVARALLIVSLSVLFGGCAKENALLLVMLPALPYAAVKALIEDDATDPVPVRRHIAARDWAACGDAQAQRKLGHSYVEGLGTERDLKEAYFWYSLSEKRGNSFARGSRNRFAADLTSELRAEIDKRIEMWVPGDCPKKDEGPDNSRVWYLADLEMAPCGDEGAQIRLARNYREGSGIEKDPKAAYYWYSVYFVAGSGTHHNARVYRERLAKQLAPDVRANIEAKAQAWTPRDCPKGRRGVLQRSQHRVDLNWAHCGHSVAQFNVARQLEKGDGVSKDRKAAYFWYSLLVSRGHVNVTYHRDRVGQFLPAKRRAEIEEKVKAWVPSECPVYRWKAQS